MYGVFSGCGQQMSLDEFKRGLTRLAVGVADEKVRELVSLVEYSIEEKVS